MHVWFFGGYNYDVMIKDVMWFSISRAHSFSSRILTRNERSLRLIVIVSCRAFVCVLVWKVDERCVCDCEDRFMRNKSNNFRFLASDISRLAIILPLQMLVPASERSSYIVDNWRWCFDVVVVWLWQWCKCCCYYSFSSLLSTKLNCCCCCLLLHGFIKEYI